MSREDEANYTVRPLTIQDIDQYNALLRYAFQVTEQELSETGWKNDEIKLEVPGAAESRRAWLF